MGDLDRWDEPIAAADDLYDEARSQWGDDAQLAKLAEEAAELSAVTSRALNGQADPDAFLEELVDARIMIEQFAHCYSPDRLEPFVEDGVDDLDRRLENDPEIATDGGQPTDGAPSEDFCPIDAIDYDGGRSEHGLTKEEIKKKFIRDALKELATHDLEYFRAMSVNAKIHSRLHDEDVFERNIDPYSIPELSDIKQFLKNHSDLGFATISYSDEFEMWAFETSNEVDERSTDD